MHGNMLLRQIVEARTEPGYRVRLTYAGGATIVVDLTHFVRQGGVFAPLADPAFFARVSVAPRGRAICWPGDVDLCADALWLQAHPEAQREVG